MRIHREPAALLAALAVAACSGGGAADPAAPDYGAATLIGRVGEALAPRLPVDAGAAAAWSIDPPLPAGLSFDPATGAIAGTPAAAADGVHRVSLERGGRRASGTLRIAIGSALPATVASLDAAWQAEVVVDGAAQPVRIAPAPDGRTFFAERQTGSIRVIDATGALLPAPFATVPTLNDGHRGLLGLAVAADGSGGLDLFAAVCTPAGAGHPERLQVLRFAAAGDVATAPPTVVLDDVALAAINVGGELATDAEGRLLVGLGDREDAALAADPASVHGKVLRLDRDGGAAAGTPTAPDRVFAKGLRNVFALALHPTTAGLFAADNGPDSDDRLVFVQPGRDFGWGAATPPSGAVEGYVVRHWVDVVVPTALAWITADELWMTSYSEDTVLRFALSGSAFTDIDREDTALAFRPAGIANKPLCVRTAPDGAVWITTFTQVLRLTRIGA